MYIDRIIYPIMSLGPGNRIVIWTSGCSKHCSKCANPELWEQNDYQYIDVDNLFLSIANQFEHVDGITITGGDPCEQMADLLQLTNKLKKITNDVLVYTGYTFDELRSLLSNDQLNQLKKNISVLVDGKYYPDLNYNNVVMRGSSNQQIIYMNADKNLKQKYEEYLQKDRMIQNVVYNNKVISVGIHNK